MLYSTFCTETQQKPTAIALVESGIPDELKQYQRWVCWRYQFRNGKWAKPMFSPTTRRFADSTDSSTWASYHDAIDAYRLWEGCTDAFDGVGCVIGSPYVGVDLDDCVVDGKLKPWATEIACKLASYAELSPSGSGIKLWCKGTLNGNSTRRKYQDGAVELYDSDRYFTVTGHSINPITCVRASQDAIDWLYTLIGGGCEKQQQPRSSRADTDTGGVCGELTDVGREVISIASFASNGELFKMLYAGRWHGLLKSQSEADLAMCGILMYYTNNNFDATDRIIRSSGLMRDKWTREDYREDTLAMAVSTNTYNRRIYND